MLIKKSPTKKDRAFIQKLGLLCFGSVKLEILKHLKQKLDKIFEHVFSEIQIIEEVKEFPESSFNPEWNKYSAPLILLDITEFVNQTNFDKVLGITSLDLYEPERDLIYGLAQYGSDAKAAIISLHPFYEEFYKPLPNMELFLLRLIKEAIHEIGHLLGLDHCTNKCVMMRSEVVLDVDKKPASFCDICWKNISSRN